MAARMAQLVLIVVFVLASLLSSITEMYYLPCAHCACPLLLMIVSSCWNLKEQFSINYQGFILWSPASSIILWAQQSPAVHCIFYPLLGWLSLWCHLSLITTTLQQVGWCPPTFLVPPWRPERTLIPFMPQRTRKKW